MTDRRPDDDPRDRDPTSVAFVEETVMVLSGLFTLALFGFAIWQAVTGAGAVDPSVVVTDSRETADGEVMYEVELRNEGDAGLVAATVHARCESPPIELGFENVPAGGYRRGTVVCPSGTDDPRVLVTTWIQE